jgi:predicted aminopeptidase
MPVRVALLLALLAITGCRTMAYLAQAGAGQDEILTKSRDVDELVRDGRLRPRERRLVAEVAQMKRFGETHGLRATKNYRKYARLDRTAAVWVVSACEPLRFRSKTWTFPIVGSITYTGWFKLADAQREGADLAKEGWDVDVRPAEAYSTLGWLEDPLLSTMLDEGLEARGELVNTVLHESTHATFYVAGQSRLNETVASFVGDTLTLRYMREVAGPDADETRAYVASEDRRATRGKFMRAAYVELEALYAGPRSDAEKRAEKARVLARLMADVSAVRPITNATLVQYATYHTGEAEIAQLYVACGSDERRLFAALGRVTPKRDQETDVGALLRPLLAQPCP